MAQWRESGLAEDAQLPANEMQAELAKLNKQWQSTFDKLAGWLSKEMARRVQKHTDTGTENRLRGVGFSVKFQQTDEMKAAYAAVVEQQVGLIKSIASEHLSDVQDLVQRSVAFGRDARYLADELQARYGITKRRAALIARDQNNKATTTMQVARQEQLGITEGIWKHSHAGKTPRPSHLAADGKRFELSKGLYLDGKWTLPGEEINCRCTYQAIIPGFRP